MSGATSNWGRWWKFNAVGAMGIVVQLAVLSVLKSGLGMNYLAATALAVEATVVHNFFWHERYTWADRASSARLARLRGRLRRSRSPSRSRHARSRPGSALPQPPS